MDLNRASILKMRFDEKHLSNIQIVACISINSFACGLVTKLCLKTLLKWIDSIERYLQVHKKSSAAGIRFIY